MSVASMVLRSTRDGVGGEGRGARVKGKLASQQVRSQPSLPETTGSKRQGYQLNLRARHYYFLLTADGPGLAWIESRDLTTDRWSELTSF